MHFATKSMVGRLENPKGYIMNIRAYFVKEYKHFKLVIIEIDLVVVLDIS